MQALNPALILSRRRDKPMAHTSPRWLRYLIIILIGNVLYFAALPHLPPAARHRRFELDLGTLVDFWFCLVVYGVFELVDFLRERGKKA